MDANTLQRTQENVIIAALRRPTLGSLIKVAGVSELHFPTELRPAYEIAMTKSQEEIRRLVTLRDPRVWPLYGKRIIEWNESQTRTAARQLVDSLASIEAPSSLSSVRRDGAYNSDSQEKPEALIYQTPEQRELFQKTLAAIREIMDGLEEVPSKRITDGLAGIEGGLWVAWGRRNKPISQKALAHLLRPHAISPVDVGPEHARRKGYKRIQFERLFRSLPPP